MAQYFFPYWISIVYIPHPKILEAHAPPSSLYKMQKTRPVLQDLPHQSYHFLDAIKELQQEYDCGQAIDDKPGAKISFAINEDRFIIKKVSNQKQPHEKSKRFDQLDNALFSEKGATEKEANEQPTRRLSHYQQVSDNLRNSDNKVWNRGDSVIGNMNQDFSLSRFQQFDMEEMSQGKQSNDLITEESKMSLTNSLTSQL